MSTPLPIGQRSAWWVIALIHLAPLLGVVGGEAMRSSYGLDALDANTELLLRHRAVLFGLLGSAALLALTSPALRMPVLAGTAISDFSFIGLVLDAPVWNTALLKLAAVDGISLALIAYLTLAARRENR